MSFIGIVHAVSFSPPNLVFNLSVGEKDCQNITLSSDSEKITLDDKWAENKDVAWNPNLFEKTAKEHKISVSYEKVLLSDKREVQICLSGIKDGEYHGILLLAEEQKGNSVIQMGVWLKAVISEEKVKEETISEKEISNSNNQITGAFVVPEDKDVVPLWKVIAGIIVVLMFVIIAVLVYRKRRNNYY